MAGMKWRSASHSITLPAPGFIQPCIPTAAKRVPSGQAWVYELKLDGYRLHVRKSGTDVRIYSRRGADFTKRFPRLVKAAQRLRATSALLDGEGIVYDQHGMPDCNLIHSKEYDREVSLVAFDLLELNGEDVRPQPLTERKRRLQFLLQPIREGIELSEHLEGDGADIFRAACKLGHEGIIAKRKDLPYESGRSKRWVKIKNPDSPAAKRVEEGSF
jgi:bifunctional non-homologous end joining protein LigD